MLEAEGGSSVEGGGMSQVQRLGDEGNDYEEDGGSS
jgi:hypothetical protein